MNGVLVLQEIIRKHNLHQQLNEFVVDVKNIYNNQQKYDAIKRLTLNSFVGSLLFVFANLIVLLLALTVLTIDHFSVATSAYFLVTGAVLSQFVRQVKLLMD